MNTGQTGAPLWAALPPAPVARNPLAIAISVLAAIETGIALLQSLKLVAPDVPIPNDLTGKITIAHLIVAPLLAIAALVFAARDRLPPAIIALAAIGLTTWASELATPPFTGSIAHVLADIVRPAVAIAAIILAIGRTQLGLAALLVAGMWLVWAWVSFLGDFLIFAAGVMIYGI